MKKLLTLTVLVIIVLNGGNNLYGQSDESQRESRRLEPVMTEEWTNNFIPKWVINEVQPTTPTLANSIMTETSNMIHIAPSEFLQNSEKLRVYGYIGLYNLLDFKTEDAAISFGNKGEGSLNFVSKGASLNQNRMTILGPTGYVGIGTDNPTALLEVAGSTKTQSLDAVNIYSVSATTNLLNADNIIATGIIANEISTDELTSDNITSIGLSTQTFKVTQNIQEGAVLTSDINGNATWQLLPEQAEQLWTKSSTNNDIFRLDGNVGIGTSVSNNYKLSVAGKILAEELEIIVSVPTSDYVFYDDYNLKPLNEVEAYIKEHKHLPEVPSAEEFIENGYGVGEMDDLLLRKVEELTLYAIDQDKTIQNMTEELKNQEDRILKLQEQIDLLLEKTK